MGLSVEEGGIGIGIWGFWEWRSGEWRVESIFASSFFSGLWF